MLGGYGSLGLGQTRIQIPGGNVFNAESLGGTTSNRIGDLDGKIMLGYNFYKFFGLEMSFADYAPSEYSAYVAHGPSAHLKYTMSALNLVGKGYIPLPLGQNSGFKIDPYGMAGIAEAWGNVNYQNTGVPFASDVNGSEFTLGGTDTSSLRPIIGAGVNYDIPKTMVSIAVEFTRISGSGDIKTNARAIPSAEMLTVNVSYNFSKPSIT
jgi:hypothetical protein